MFPIILRGLIVLAVIFYAGYLLKKIFRRSDRVEKNEERREELKDAVSDIEETKKEESTLPRFNYKNIRKKKATLDKVKKEAKKQ